MNAEVLVADDDDRVRRALVTVLERNGFTVTQVNEGQSALALLSVRRFDALVSDIMMPGLTGVELLRAARERDPDLPVVLVTGTPELETAMMAVNLGAYRYLPKPVDVHELVETVRRATHLRQLAHLKRAALAAVDAESRERAELEVHFQRGLEGLWMAYQPIVEPEAKRVAGFEALLRSDEPAMARPDEFIAAAVTLGRVHELGRAVRARVVADAPRFPDGVDLFLNLLPADLNDEELYAPDSMLGPLASRVVLELTERASLTEIPDVSRRVVSLREAGFRLAVDDLGAGYSGLSSLTQLEPEVVKLDMSLVRGIDASASRQAVVKAMVELCGSMRLAVVAEGIETVAERTALAELGVRLMQGYHFARPSREVTIPVF